MSDSLELRTGSIEGHRSELQHLVGTTQSHKSLSHSRLASSFFLDLLHVVALKARPVPIQGSPGSAIQDHRAYCLLLMHLVLLAVIGGFLFLLSPFSLVSSRFFLLGLLKQPILARPH